MPNVLCSKVSRQRIVPTMKNSFQRLVRRRGCVASPFSSIRFGFEQALSPSPAIFVGAGKSGIPINGTVWMGDKATMRRRIAEKLDAGFGVLKLKIGGISFDDELDLLDSVRRTFSSDALEIRRTPTAIFCRRGFRGSCEACTVP